MYYGMFNDGVSSIYIYILVPSMCCVMRYHDVLSPLRPWRVQPYSWVPKRVLSSAVHVPVKGRFYGWCFAYHKYVVYHHDFVIFAPITLICTEFDSWRSGATNHEAFRPNLCLLEYVASREATIAGLAGATVVCVRHVREKYCIGGPCSCCMLKCDMLPQYQMSSNRTSQGINEPSRIFCRIERKEKSKRTDPWWIDKMEKWIER